MLDENKTKEVKIRQMMDKRVMTRMPKRLPPTPNQNPLISTPNINNRIISENIIILSKLEYRKEAQKGLKELLEADCIRQEVKQDCLDELSYSELMSSISKEPTNKKPEHQDLEKVVG